MAKSPRAEVWGFRGTAVFVGWVQAVAREGSTAPGAQPFGPHKEGSRGTAKTLRPRGSPSLIRVQILGEGMG